MSKIPASMSRTFYSIQAPVWSLLLAGFLLFAGLTASLIYDRMEKYNVFSTLVPGHPREGVAFLLVFCSGGLFGMLCLGLAQSGWQETASCFWIPIKRTGIFIWTAGVLLLSLFVWCSSAWMSSEDRNRFGHLIQHDPGGLFAAFMGLVTIVGFAFTLHDLREMRRRITSFPDLIDRLTVMLSRKGLDEIRFLAYTPALGYIALEDNEFKTFYDALRRTGAEDMPRLDMTCLTRKDLAEWHDLFIGRRTRRRRFESEGTAVDKSKQKTASPGFVGPPLANAATRMGEHIIEDLLHEREIDASDNTDTRVKRLPFEFLPGYYFFLSSERAIVVAPLQLPFPKGAPRDAHQHNRTVQMLGFETNDRAIIHDLADLYDSYKLLPSSYIAEYSDVMGADQITKWCNNEVRAHNATAGAELESKGSIHFANSQGALAEILRQFNIASGRKPADSTDVAAQQLRSDYQRFMDPAALEKTKIEITIRVSLNQESDN
jgi:hypothetical protein